MRLLVVSLALAAACLAQDINGTIVGTVQDPAGAGVPGENGEVTGTAPGTAQAKKAGMP